MKQQNLNSQQFSEETRFLDSLLDFDTLKQTPIKTTLSFTNSLLSNELFFSSLTAILLQLATLKTITKQQKQNAYMQLVELSLNSNNLASAFEYYGILVHTLKCNNSVLFKLDKLFCEKYYDLLQYKQALPCLQKMIHNKKFNTLTEKQQKEIVLHYAAVLLQLKKQKIDITFENLALQQFATTLNEQYFSLLHSSHKKQKQLLSKFEKFYNHPSTSNLIKQNILLQLPILKIFIKNNQILFPYRVLTSFGGQTLAPNLRKEVLLLLLPILKNKNIQEFLDLTPLVPITLTQLDDSVQNILENYTKLAYENYQLQSSLKEKELILKTDNLTGCLNANALDDVTIDFKTSYGAVVFFDLNKLKEYNDAMGHQAGDTYLKAFSNNLLVHKSQTVSIYRIGGDEFLLLAEHKTKEQITTILDKLVKACNKKIKINNKLVNISFSAGISLFPEHRKNLNKLTLCADKAMIQAKQKCILKQNH